MLNAIFFLLSSLCIASLYANVQFNLIFPYPKDDHKRNFSGQTYVGMNCEYLNSRINTTDWSSSREAKKSMFAHVISIVSRGRLAMCAYNRHYSREPLHSELESWHALEISFTYRDRISWMCVRISANVRRPHTNIYYNVQSWLSAIKNEESWSSTLCVAGPSRTKIWCLHQARTIISSREAEKYKMALLKLWLYCAIGGNSWECTVREHEVFRVRSSTSIGEENTNEWNYHN